MGAKLRRKSSSEAADQRLGPSFSTSAASGIISGSDDNGAFVSAGTP
jgi:hypothetical protein